jgi:two-component system, LuxR family, sensor histidine kinase DctS
MFQQEMGSQNSLLNIDYASFPILSAIPNPVIILNSDTSIEYVNPAAETITGFSQPELVGHKTPYPYCPDIKIHEYSLEFEKGLPPSPCKEFLFQKKNGLPFWVSMTSTPITVNRNFTCMLTIWNDITIQIITEEKLRRSEERLRLLAESREK